MLALLSVWVGLISMVLAIGMCFFRTLFTDLNVVLVLYFGSPGALCFAGLVLWAYRKEGRDDEGINAQCLQARVGLTFGLIAATLVYILVIYAERVSKGN
ncbi:MAG: hypothetical protein ACPGXK_05895 [Phycisphaerae bacterium]